MVLHFTPQPQFPSVLNDDNQPVPQGLAGTPEVIGPETPALGLVHLPFSQPLPGRPLQSSSPVPAPPASLPLVSCRTVSPHTPGSVSAGKQVSAPAPLGAPSETLRPKAPRNPERQTPIRYWVGAHCLCAGCRLGGLLCVPTCILGDPGALGHRGVQSLVSSGGRPTIWKWRGASLAVLNYFTNVWSYVFASKAWASVTSTQGSWTAPSPIAPREIHSPSQPPAL